MELSSERVERLSTRTGFLARYVEKVVRLLDLLEEIQSHEDLKDQFVLKGGTALNVFFFNLPRLIQSSFKSNSRNRSNREVFRYWGSKSSTPFTPSLRPSTSSNLLRGFNISAE